jgi:hypothetical protein
MSTKERGDIQTRFKKGQSGNPNGRPKGRKTDTAIVREVLFRPIRINEAGKSRTVSKIQGAFEVCINKALKGDIRAFVKMLEIAERLKLFRPEPDEREITTIRRVIVYPDGSERDL